MNIKEVFEQNKEGFSIDVENMSLFDSDRGFSVAITDHKINIDNIEAEFNRLLKIGYGLINANKVLIGGWNDGTHFYLDISVYIEDPIQAKETARVFNQISVYSFGLSDVLTLEELDEV